MAVGILQASEINAQDMETLQLLQQKGAIHLIFRDEMTRLTELITGGLPFEVVVAGYSGGKNLLPLCEAASGKVLLLVDERGSEQGIHLAESIGAKGALARPFGPADLLEAIRAVANGQTYLRNPLAEAVAGESDRRGQQPAINALALQEVSGALSVTKETVERAVRYIHDTYDLEREPEALAAVRLLESVAIPSLDDARTSLESLKIGQANPLVIQADLDAHANTINRILAAIREHAPTAIVQILSNVASTIVLRVLSVG